MMGIELPIQDPLIQFAALVALALLVQRAFERVQLPGLIGLLIIGMLLGPGGAGVLPREPIAALFGQVGLLYVMFLAGLEIDLDIVRRHRRETATFGLLAFGCSLLPAVAVGVLLGFTLPEAALFGTLLSSHTLLAYPIILRLGLLQRKAVVTAISGTVVTDTLALVLLAVVIQTAANGSGLGGLLPLALLAGLVAASVALLPRIGRAFFRRADVRRPEKALFTLVVLVLLATVAELIGTEEILGAFLAGLCLNRPLQEREDLREHVEFVGRMLFIPLFFIATGMLLELAVFTQGRVGVLAGVMFGLVLLGKGTAAWLTAILFGYSWRDGILMTGLTIPQAAATLAVTITARETGLFDEEVVDAVILLIFVSCLVGPLMTRYVGRQLTQHEGD